MRNACNNQAAVAFVNEHKSDCMVIADMLKVPVENILGLAAHESQYGTGRIARSYNNYFSMHAPAPLQSGEIAPLGDPKKRVAIFPSFLISGRSFATRFGPFVTGLSDPDAFAKALVKHHYNPGSNAKGGVDHYDKLLVGVIAKVKERMSCKQ